MKVPVNLSIFYVLLIASAAQAGLPPDDAPTTTVALRTPKGAEVRLTYQALRWDPETLEMIQSASEEGDAKQIREYYSKYITPRLAQLTTNVTLKSSTFTLAPGTYRIGFVGHGGEWSFVAGNQEGGQAEIPVSCTAQPFETRHLALLLVPGDSDDALQLVVLYGPHTVTLGFLLTGEPIPVTETEPPLYKRYFGGLRGEEITPATPERTQPDWRLRTLRPPKPSPPSLGPPPNRGSLR